MSSINEINYEDDRLFNDEFMVNTDPSQNPDLTNVGEWTPEKISDYRKEKSRANIRELIIFARKYRHKSNRERKEREAKIKIEVEEKAKAKKRVIMNVILGAATVVGASLATHFMARWLGS